MFSFPRGAKHGTFLHELFEEIDFQDSATELLVPWLIERLTINNYEEPEIIKVNSRQGSFDEQT